eukprot:CAMPEP_0201565048 /NCGR_PEP_ID=MMETSP0190_2-20130828/3877_1 /ASSEMBLY_ACC=CAM_ASM_000263 /TAXON_ID=37353 /ORGANISM="Rosalina sp." /LENGTH=396 /DNA_ID=CAMNT_0047982051 /DNA_START=25 /DNA_END=1215 /DNA_ORIENTATION=+
MATLVDWNLSSAELRKKLLKLSKSKLVKACKYKQVSTVGNKKEMIDRIMGVDTSNVVIPKKKIRSVKPGSVVPHPPPSNPTVAIPPAKDWVMLPDPSSGKMYYANLKTKETSWTAPPGFHSGFPVTGQPPQAQQVQNQQQAQQINYYGQQKPLLTIAVLGDKLVGKSSLIKPYTQSKEFSSASVENGSFITFKDFNLRIMEVSGIDEESPVKNMECDAYVIVYDVTKQKPFESIDKWIFLYRTSAPTILIANKCDLLELLVYGYCKNYDGDISKDIMKLCYEFYGLKGEICGGEEYAEKNNIKKHFGVSGESRMNVDDALQYVSEEANTYKNRPRVIQFDYFDMMGPRRPASEYRSAFNNKHILQNPGPQYFTQPQQQQQQQQQQGKSWFGGFFGK